MVVVEREGEKWGKKSVFIFVGNTKLEGQRRFVKKGRQRERTESKT